MIFVFFGVILTFATSFTYFFVLFIHIKVVVLKHGQPLALASKNHLGRGAAALLGGVLCAADEAIPIRHGGNHASAKLCAGIRSYRAVVVAGGGGR